MVAGSSNDVCPYCGGEVRPGEGIVDAPVRHTVFSAHVGPAAVYHRDCSAEMLRERRRYVLIGVLIGLAILLIFAAAQWPQLTR